MNTPIRPTSKTRNAVCWIMLCLWTLITPLGSAPSSASATPPSSSIPSPSKNSPSLASISNISSSRWVEFAQGVSEITASAVSPMLVVCIIGANRYLRSPEAERDQLPDFCRPLLWGTGLFLLTLCFIKDAFGPALPALLKKPLDMLELFENKFSALIASIFFVPAIASEMMRHFGPVAAFSLLPEGTFIASVSPASVGDFDVRWILIPAAILCFITIWLTAHVVNVLVAICPFGFVDALMKVCKNGVLGFLVVCTALHPYLGAAVSGVLLIFAALVAGRAFRFLVFGAVFAGDVLLLWPTRKRPVSGPARAFLARGMGGAPARTLGRMVLEPDGTFAFHYRPWLVLPVRRVPMPLGTPVLSRNLLTVSLLWRAEADQRMKVIEFPPRYRLHVASLCTQYAISEIEDGGIVGGIKTAWSWLREAAGFHPVSKVASASSEAR